MLERSRTSITKAEVLADGSEIQVFVEVTAIGLKADAPTAAQSATWVINQHLQKSIEAGKPGETLNPAQDKKTAAKELFMSKSRPKDEPAQPQ